MFNLFRSAFCVPCKYDVPQGSVLGLTHFLLYINDLPDDVACDTAIYADDINLESSHFKFWQQLEFSSELKSGLRDTGMGVGSALLISEIEKLNLFHLIFLISMVL